MRSTRGAAFVFVKGVPMPSDSSPPPRASALGDNVPSSILWEILGGLAAVLGCWAVLHWGVRMPDWLHLRARSGDQALSGAAGPLVLAVGVYGALSLPAPCRRIAVISLVLTGCSLGLAELWSGGSSTHDAVAGLLPISDARDYAFEAGRLLDGHTLSSWGSRRPIASDWLAEMLWVSHGSLQTGVATLGLFAALALALLVLQVGRRFGAAGAATAFFVLFMFYRRFLGTSLSENGGFAFGSLGLGLLIEAMAARRLGLLALGVFCLTTGSTSGPPPFSCRPAWWLPPRGSGEATGAERRRRRLRRARRSVIALAANAGLYHVLASSQGMMFSNLAESIYGTINGGDLGTVHKEHPEIFRLPEGYARHPELYEVPERKEAAAVLGLVRAELAREPTLALKGAARAWLAFLLNRGGPYVYIRSWFLEKMMMMLGVVGIVGALSGLRRRGDSSLIVSGAVGIALSLPFAPPWDSDSMRVYATTVPFFALFSAAGMSLLCRLAYRRFWLTAAAEPAPDGARVRPQGLLVVTGCALAASVYLFPLYARFGRSPEKTNALRRFEDHAELAMEYRSGNAVRVVPDGAARSACPRCGKAILSPASRNSPESTLKKAPFFCVWRPLGRPS